MTRRIWALALGGIAWGLVPGTARARHHHSLREYGIAGYMTQDGFFVNYVYADTEAQDNGLDVGDLIIKGNGDFIGNPNDIVEDLVNSQNGFGPAVFLVRKGRTGRYVQVVSTGR